MNNYLKIILFFLCLNTIAACSTVLGPPNSENELPLVPSKAMNPYDMFIEGQPNLNLLTVRGGLYIWKINDSWHVRLSEIDRLQRVYPVPPVFTGSIFVDNGILVNIVRKNVSPINEVRYRMNDLAFRFELRSGIEGFDFQLQPTGISHCVTLDFQLNGLPTPDLVYLGRTMYTPDLLPIRMCFN
jgi:hypothetical protein